MAADGRLNPSIQNRWAELAAGRPNVIPATDAGDWAFYLTGVTTRLTDGADDAAIDCSDDTRPEGPDQVPGRL